MNSAACSTTQAWQFLLGCDGLQGPGYKAGRNVGGDGRSRTSCQQQQQALTCAHLLTDLSQHSIGQKCMKDSSYQLKEFCLLMEMQLYSYWKTIWVRDTVLKDLIFFLITLIEVANYANHSRTGWISSPLFRFF